MKKNKILAAVAAAALCLSALPVNVFAAPSDTLSSGAALTAAPAAGANRADYPEYPKEGSVQMQKSAEWTDYQKGEATIHFSVAGVPANAGVDVVLILDRSGTMSAPAIQDAVCGEPTANYTERDMPPVGLPAGYYRKYYTCPVCGYGSTITYNEKGGPVKVKQNAHGDVIKPVQYVPAEGLPETCPGNTSKMRMQVVKGAAKNFVEIMMKENADGTPSQNKVGMVSFDTYAQVDVGISGRDQKSQLLGAIDELYPRGDTDYTRAFEAAERLLAARGESDRPA